MNIYDDIWMIYEDSVSDITGYHIKMLISNISDHFRTNTSFDRFYDVHWSQHKATNIVLG